MKNDIAFSDRQVEQLAELFETQRQATLRDVEKLLDVRFTKERGVTQAMMNDRFIEEREVTRAMMNDRFIEERSTIRTIIQTELADFRDRLEQLEHRQDSDIKSAFIEIDTVKDRLVLVETKVVAFTK